MKPRTPVKSFSHSESVTAMSPLSRFFSPHLNLQITADFSEHPLYSFRFIFSASGSLWEDEGSQIPANVNHLFAFFEKAAAAGAASQKKVRFFIFQLAGKLNKQLDPQKFVLRHLLRYPKLGKHKDAPAELIHFSFPGAMCLLRAYVHCTVPLFRPLSLFCLFTSASRGPVFSTSRSPV